MMQWMKDGAGGLPDDLFRIHVDSVLLVFYLYVFLNVNKIS